MTETIRDDVVILGAGILGASLAYHLTQVGMQVTIVDAHPSEQRSTQASFACVNGSAKTEPVLAALNDRGVAEYHDISDSLGAAAARFTGQYFVATDAGSLRVAEERVRAAQERGYGGELIDGATFREREPLLHLQEEPLAVAWFEADGWVDPEALRKHYLADLQVQQRHALAIQADRVRRPRIRFADGPDVEAHIVVNATGAGAATLDIPGLPNPFTPANAGLVVSVETASELVSAVIRTPSLGIRPDGHHRSILHSHDIDTMITDGTLTPADGADRLIDRVRGAFRYADDVTVHRITAGPRLIPPGGPSVGRLPGVRGCYELVAYSGVTLAPLLGRLLASEVLTATDEPLLAPFRPRQVS